MSILSAFLGRVILPLISLCTGRRKGKSDRKGVSSDKTDENDGFQLEPMNLDGPPLPNPDDVWEELESENNAILAFKTYVDDHRAVTPHAKLGDWSLPVLMDPTRPALPPPSAEMEWTWSNLGEPSSSATASKSSSATSYSLPPSSASTFNTPRASILHGRDPLLHGRENKGVFNYTNQLSTLSQADRLQRFRQMRFKDPWVDSSRPVVSVATKMANVEFYGNTHFIADMLMAARVIFGVYSDEAAARILASSSQRTIWTPSGGTELGADKRVQVFRLLMERDFELAHWLAGQPLFLMKSLSLPEALVRARPGPNLFDTPQEIRDIIWRIHLVQADRIPLDKLRVPKVFGVSKQVLREVESMYYKVNKFRATIRMSHTYRQALDPRNYHQLFKAAKICRMEVERLALQKFSGFFATDIHLDIIDANREHFGGIDIVLSIRGRGSLRIICRGGPESTATIEAQMCSNMEDIIEPMIRDMMKRKGFKGLTFQDLRMLAEQFVLRYAVEEEE